MKSAKQKPLDAGLHVIATPIGNRGDISFRAVETLRACDLIVCEDTRVSGKLLNHFDIRTPLLSYNDHNAPRQRPLILEKLVAGERIGLISDAGTPLISDPGYKLVEEAIAAGIRVIPIPGACAATTALSVSGLPTDRFAFLGFIPQKQSERERLFIEFGGLRATLIFYESANRIADTLTELAKSIGDRQAVVARELTKLFEEIRRASIAELAAHYANSPTPKGEIVLLIGAAHEAPADDAMLDDALRKALVTMRVKEAAEYVSEALKLPRQRVYKRALALKP